IDASYVIVHASVDKRLHDGMRIKVRDVLFGVAVPGSIFVPKGNGADCRVNTDIFERGSEYLFALWSHDGKFSLSTCGVTWLEVRSGTVRGAIAEGIDEVRLDAFHTVVACGVIPSPLGSLQIGPNPAGVQLLISTDAPLDEAIDVHIYDIAGREVLQRTIDMLASDPFEIDVRHLPAAIYVVTAEYKGIRRTCKIAVQSM
ncbi:MAG: T9SS type A sorting domain-containing protein, partial [Saprospiraceae bacterium]|nr:T9SS type A sorting domain-containing protein [Saprospiraceae bacterium]